MFSCFQSQLEHLKPIPFLFPSDETSPCHVLSVQPPRGWPEDREGQDTGSERVLGQSWDQPGVGALTCTCVCE